MNKKMLELGNNRSIIRELFEFSKIQKEKYGADKVYDFTLGNPSVPPHKAVDETIVELLNTKSPSYNHGYTSAPGDNEVRNAIAQDLNKRFGTNYKLTNLYMTCGAAASLCITFKAITESSSDEILAMAPYFTEYKVFVEASGAKFGIVPANETFGVNFSELDKMITKNTKAIIVNSPNNPSGVVYSEDEIKKFAELLLKKEKEFNHPIYLVCDEPYREIVYDGLTVPHIPSYYHNTVICYSYSKCLSLPGDRIGYILVPDQVDDSKDLYAACLGAGRALGYVCAPSLYQKVIERCATLTSDMNEYKKNRDLLYNGLKNIGFECIYPQGAFYLFVKSPEPDANNFMEKAKKYNIVVVPSDGFGVKGYVRLAYCVSSKTIVDSLPAFEKLYNEYK